MRGVGLVTEEGKCGERWRGGLWRSTAGGKGRKSVGDPEVGGVFRAPRVECSSGVLQAEEQFGEGGMTHGGERSWFWEVLPAAGSYS